MAKTQFQVTNAHSALQKLNLPDLKRHCIVRGIPFEKVGDSSILQLQSWFLKNYNNKVDISLLDKYDDWLEAYLKARNVDKTMLDPIFRLGHISERDDEGNVTKVKRVRGMGKKVQKKRERTEEGIFTGTKKAYAVELQKQGLTKAEVTEKVMEKFPDAKEKSISIWFNKAKNGKLR